MRDRQERIPGGAAGLLSLERVAHGLGRWWRAARRAAPSAPGSAPARRARRGASARGSWRRCGTAAGPPSRKNVTMSRLGTSPTKMYDRISLRRTRHSSRRRIHTRPRAAGSPRRAPAPACRPYRWRRKRGWGRRRTARDARRSCSASPTSACGEAIDARSQRRTMTTIRQRRAAPDGVSGAPARIGRVAGSSGIRRSAARDARRATDCLAE